jgi:protein gp37
MKNSKIEWTNHTINFWWGCVKISPGCENCYAETLSKRAGQNIWGPAQTTERRYIKNACKNILKWDEAAGVSGIRKRVFCQSMSDFFEVHPQLNDWRQEAFDILESLKWLDIQMLTKRPENVMEMVPYDWCEDWPAHIWIGTSVENQKYLDERMVHLYHIPARVKFLSCEPLLEAIDLSRWLGIVKNLPKYRPDIHWVIIGGESGARARPFNIKWGINLIEQCKVAEVPVFMKQLGSNCLQLQTIDKKGGNPGEWPFELQIREFPLTEAI